MTTQEELDQVKADILKVQSGAQEYGTGSRRLRRADLNALYKERDRLEWKLAQENGVDTNVGVFDGR